MSENGLNTLTVLEIFSNPFDLEICVGEAKEKNYFAFVILRGPGHNFKLMLEGMKKADKVEEIISWVEKLLKLTVESSIKMFGEKNNPITQIFNANNEPLDKSAILTEKLIEQITKDLKETGTASTYRYAH